MKHEEKRRIIVKGGPEFVGGGNREYSNAHQDRDTIMKNDKHSFLVHVFTHAVLVALVLVQVTLGVGS